MGHPTQSIKHAQVVAVCTNSFSDAPRPLWVNFCSAISRNVRLLYPIKLPRQPFAIEAVKGRFCCRSPLNFAATRDSPAQR